MRLVENSLQSSLRRTKGNEDIVVFLVFVITIKIVLFDAMLYF